MSAKVDTATGVISVSIFGVQAALAPADALAWGDTLLQLAPALLILFLIWRMWKLDKQHEECTKAWTQTRNQLSLTYHALLDDDIKCRLPEERDFMAGNFDIEEVTKERRHHDRS